MEIQIPVRRRRTHTESFKLAVIHACQAPGASVAGVALAHAVNANQVRRWLRERGISLPARLSVAVADTAPAPVDMRTGADRLLAQVIQMLGAAQPHHAWLFANRRGNRLKVLVHDGHGIWLAQRRLHQGRFHWQNGEAAVTQISEFATHVSCIYIPTTQNRIKVISDYFRAAERRGA